MSKSQKQKNGLPTLKGLLFPVIFTMRRGKKSIKGDTDVDTAIKNLYIDKNHLKNYKEFFGISKELPLCYLYILAQRAQLKLMVTKEFPLSVPGLVHIENRIMELDTILLEKPFSITVSCHIPYKEEGSLFPKFTVEYIQNNKKVAECTSLYMAKRKSSKKKKEDNKIQEKLPNYQYSEQWSLPQNSGFQYAKISGDFNLIHISKFFGKMAGFKGSIIHGWYSVTRTVTAIEKKLNRECKDIDVIFKKPIKIPNEVNLFFTTINNSTVDFVIKNSDEEIMVKGKV